ncbi:trimethylamine methyltransferase family protein [Chloroflexota bacterium]
MIRRGLKGGTFKPLDESGIKQIHKAAMRAFEEIGFEVSSELALDHFVKAGAKVEKSTGRVQMSEGLVTELIELAPSEIVLHGQDEKHDVTLGGARVHTATGGTALYIYEPATNQRRPATLPDLKNVARLVDQLENIHVLLLPTYPTELSVEEVDINRFFTGLDNTSKHVMGGVYTREGVRRVLKMARIAAGSAEALRERPIISMITCTISPMRIDQRYGDLIVDIATGGIPVVCPAEPLCGATSPTTLAGNITMLTIDSLMGVLLTQAVNPGTPVIFGSVASNTDLGGLSYLAGSVEMGLINAAGAQMAQFYQLPFYATGGMTDSKMLDAQAGYESAITGLMCALAGANFIHDSAGLMESAMSVSLEKLVIDNEILGMVMRGVEGITVNDDTIAYDLIKQIGPGGNFLTAKHTRRNMRKEHYQPTLSDRQSREAWRENGEKETWQRAANTVKQLLANTTHRLPEQTRARILTEVKGIIE